MRSLASRACFAVGDSRTPVRIAIISMVVNVVGDLTLGVYYGVPGLAASTSLSLLVGAGLLVHQLARRHDALALRPFAVAAARVCLAAAVAAGAGAALGSAYDGGSGVLPTLLSLGLTSLTLAVVYLAALLAMRSRELDEVVTVLRQRFVPRRRG